MYFPASLPFSMGWNWIKHLKHYHTNRGGIMPLLLYNFHTNFYWKSYLIVLINKNINICHPPLSVLQTFPFFGVVPAILNESGEELEGPSEGYLVRIIIIHMSWTDLWLVSRVLTCVRCLPTGVQTAVARFDEDSVRKPPEVWNRLLQEVPRILRHRRRWETRSAGGLCEIWENIYIYSSFCFLLL